MYKFAFLPSFPPSFLQHIVSFSPLPPTFILEDLPMAALPPSLRPGEQEIAEWSELSEWVIGAKTVS